MTRVLGLVTFRIYPTLMGGQKGVALFYEHLKKFATVVLAFSGNNDSLDDDSLPTKKILYSNRLIFLNLLRIGVLKKLVRQQNINLVIAEHSYAGWIAWLLKQSTGIPFVIHSHNLEALRFKHMRRWWWKPYMQYEKWIHQKADFNFFISDDDKMYAIRHFQLAADKCATITYGVKPFEKSSISRTQFLQTIGLNDSCHLLFFNGTLDYKPNYDTVYTLGTEVAPRLKKRVEHFKILISGNRIPNQLKDFINRQGNMMYLDYVPDVTVLYQATQLFINPILNNTGVKTKVIEAVANHCTVVSTVSGAAGICKAVCGVKLTTVADGDWDGFADCITEQLRKPHEPTPDAFFEFYLWDTIAHQAVVKIAETIQRHAAI